MKLKRFILDVATSWTTQRPAEDQAAAAAAPGAAPPGAAPPAGPAPPAAPAPDAAAAAERVPRARYGNPESRFDVQFHGHELAEYPPTEMKSKPRRRCRLHYDKEKKRVDEANKKNKTNEKPSRAGSKDTYYYCTACKVPLCVLCFCEYHKR